MNVFISTSGAKEQFNGFHGGFSGIGMCQQYMPFGLVMGGNQFQQDRNMMQGPQVMQNTNLIQKSNTIQNPNMNQNPQMMPNQNGQIYS